MICLMEQIKESREHIYPVALKYHGQLQETYGLYDTGNRLCDTVTGAPVSVADPEILRSLLSEELTDRLLHLKERPEEIETALSVLPDRRTGSAADSGSDIRGSLYSDSGRADPCIRTGVCIVFRTFCFGKGIQSDIEFQIIALGGAGYEQIGSRSGLSSVSGFSEISSFKIERTLLYRRK